MKYMLSFQCESEDEAQAVLSAVAAIGKEPMACSRQYIPANEIPKSDGGQERSAVTMLLEHDRPERDNVNPGEPTIGKIGGGTKEQLLGMLRDGHQPPEKWGEHMKLLWSRNEVKFDGRNYYL